MSLKYELSKPFLPAAAYLSALYFRHGKPSNKTAERLFSLLNKYVNHHGYSFEATTAFHGKLRVTTKDFLQNKIFYFGLWEPRLTQYILSRPHSDGTFLDIGANIGYFSIAAASRFKKVIAIEASPDIVALLKRNIDRNRLENVTIENVAIGHKNGEIFVNLAHDDNIGRTAITEHESSSSKKIRIATIGDLLDREELSKLRFIKIDVEGAEFSVFESILTVIDVLHPQLEIVAEVSPADDRGERKAQEKTWAAILEKGFTPHILQEEYCLSDYIEKNLDNSELKAITTMPNRQTDLLFRRNSG